jgi:hypothetical protein
MRLPVGVCWLVCERGLMFLLLFRPAKTTRPGVRQVAPKKANLIKQRKLTKV